jgi:hypothetical protein
MERYAEAAEYAQRFLALSDGVREAFLVDATSMLLHSLAELDGDVDLLEKLTSKIPAGNP